ncbi:MAG: 2-alkenal reductase [Pseudohongiella sp.]|nr:MAG: 2-alkenal reductase [Pseudohongiella sp.]
MKNNKHESLSTILGFLSWPVICGILLALVIVQYQQLRSLSLMPPAPVIAEANREPDRVSFREAIHNAAPAVVSINATSVNVEGIESASQDGVNFLLGERASLGSGVILSEDGFILTKLHVVDSLFNAFDTTVTLNDGRSSPATVVGWDQTNDLAVLHVNMDNLTPIDIGDSTKMAVGDIVLAIGYPRNIGQSVSQGIISAISDGEEATGNRAFIQTDAAINPGNSGGALIDQDGKLIGINSSIISESGTFEGIGFATRVELAIEVLDDLVSTAIDQNPGYLGVIAGEVLTEQSSELFFGVADVRGMLVESVDRGGPAERAGIRPGDVLTSVENTAVVNEQIVILEIQNKKPGDRIAVQVYRNGQILNMEVILGFGQAVVIEA